MPGRHKPKDERVRQLGASVYTRDLDKLDDLERKLRALHPNMRINRSQIVRLMIRAFDLDQVTMDRLMASGED